MLKSKARPTKNRDLKVVLKSSPKTMADLRPASYNPRTISSKAKEAMRKSYMRYGDLSGIIVNRVTGNIVGGHQRTDIFRKGTKNRIEAKPHQDKNGTVAIGHVEIAVKTDKGPKLVRIPYREVKWDIDTERAANIAANAAGGEFDQVKLGQIVRDLEKRRFPIEDIPIDAFELKRAITLFETEQTKKGLKKASGDAFEVVDPHAIAGSLEHTCPRCGYSWSGNTKKQSVLSKTKNKGTLKRAKEKKAKKR